MPNTKIKIEGGKIWDIKAFINSIYFLSDGEYLVCYTPLIAPRNIEEWRHLYFALRDIVYQDGGTGLSKSEIHSQAKYSIIPKLWDDTENWSAPPTTVSTKGLSEKGWQMYLNLFKEFALENFNCYL